MTFSKHFKLHLAFLTFFVLLTFVRAVPTDSSPAAPQNETFTETLIRENKDVIDSYLNYNPYFKALSTGKATNAEFQSDIIQENHFLAIWSKSLGYALSRAPVPAPKDWNLGDVPPEYFVIFLSTIIGGLNGYFTLLKNISTTHKFDIYSEPIAPTTTAEGEYELHVIKDLSFEAYLVENWASFRFFGDGIAKAQAAIKANGYKYDFQDYLDALSAPTANLIVQQFETLVNNIYKSKGVNKTEASIVLREHIKIDNLTLAHAVTG